jgi:hypothetical protein
LPDRILRGRSGKEALDDVVFDALGLTEAERKPAKQMADWDVYWAMCELVQNRLKKARSV